MTATEKRDFGNVRKLPSGNWQARYRGPDGRDHRAPTTFVRRGHAERWLLRERDAMTPKARQRYDLIADVIDSTLATL